MATSKLFKKVPLTAPNRSGFNMSHNNFFSAPVGTLVPNLIDFLIPGDEIDLSSKSHVQLPPMATDFYGRIEYKEEAFFVPCRILFGGWKDFFVNPVDGTTNPSNIEGQLAKYLIGSITSSGVSFFENGNFLAFFESASPRIQYSFDGSVDVEDTTEYSNDIWNMLEEFQSQMLPRLLNSAFVHDVNSTDVGPGSLADFLGFKVGNSSNPVVSDIDKSISEVLQIFKDDPSVWTSSFDSFIEESFIQGLESHFNPLVSTSDAEFGVYRMNISFEPPVFGFYIRFIRDFDFDDITALSEVKINNILPFMAYHKIYDDWYRSPQIQQSLFKRNVANSSTATSVANMPWITSGAEDKVYLTGDQLLFANGHNLFDLHQRNWQKDFFTSMTPEPQAGDASSVKFDIVDDSGEFTIASLRAANALQQWLDRNNIGGFRYGDMIYSQYGVYPSDAITDRAIYLGSSSVEVYNKSIYQQSGDGGENTNNPFNAIGSKYSNPTGVGQGSFCNNYRVTEAGFVVKIGSLVPQAYYSTGVRRMFHYNTIADIAFPVLAGVGDQEVYARELVDVYSGEGNTDVLGYQQRYAEYKFIDDQVHGKLRDGENLASFALQRSFSQAPQLGSEFLQIPIDYLDQVSATDYKLSEYGCWVNCYNDYRKSSTLPAYSIPTLEDMKGHTILVDKGGNYIA